MTDKAIKETVLAVVTFQKGNWLQVAAMASSKLIMVEDTLDGAYLFDNIDDANEYFYKRLPLVCEQSIVEEWE